MPTDTERGRGGRVVDKSNCLYCASGNPQLTRSDGSVNHCLREHGGRRVVQCLNPGGSHLHDLVDAFMEFGRRIGHPPPMDACFRGELKEKVDAN